MGRYDESWWWLWCYFSSCLMMRHAAGKTRRESFECNAEGTPRMHPPGEAEIASEQD